MTDKIRLQHLSVPLQVAVWSSWIFGFLMIVSFIVGFIAGVKP
jgi:hypothetical protein